VRQREKDTERWRDHREREREREGERMRDRRREWERDKFIARSESQLIISKHVINVNPCIMDGFQTKKSARIY
jgi:hypothetical protein